MTRPVGADDDDGSRLVRAAFDEWKQGTGSIYDLMDADAQIVIPGTSRHCGTFVKADFLRDVAGPFVARFSAPPVPRLRDLWRNERGVVATADAAGVARDGTPYANRYVFVFDMVAGRASRVTEYLDMAAFEAVWDRVEPAPADAG